MSVVAGSCSPSFGAEFERSCFGLFSLGSLAFLVRHPGAIRHRLIVLIALVQRDRCARSNAAVVVDHQEINQVIGPNIGDVRGKRLIVLARERVAWRWIKPAWRWIKPNDAADCRFNHADPHCCAEGKPARTRDLIAPGRVPPWDGRGYLGLNRGGAFETAALSAPTSAPKAGPSRT